jgi:Uncharacterized conserved protein
MNNKSGDYVIQLSGEAQYKSFLPTSLEQLPPIKYDDSLVGSLVKASYLLGNLNGKADKIPDIGLFISMYIRKEALLSSQIEGTQVSLEDILDPLIEDNQNLDVNEVLNYIQALNFAISKLDELPLCNRLILQTHKVLMDGLRGGETYTGEFRRTQNWIGHAGSTLSNARYIPPSPDDMIVAMSDLEKYFNQDDDTNVLVKVALIHYQFETIHPFIDGNGRMGRLLIILYLMQQKILSQPILYISYFLKLNRIEYYDRLTEVRAKGDYEQWITFFINAIIQATDDSIQTIDKLTELRSKNIDKIAALGRVKPNAELLYNYIEQSPIIDIQKTAQTLNLSYNTVSALVKNFIEMDILVQNENVKRGKTYSYYEYLNILRKDTDIK